jgi:26S proteasome regulatory subunit N9
VAAARAGVRAEAGALAALREPDATVAAAVHRTAALLAKVGGCGWVGAMPRRPPFFFFFFFFSPHTLPLSPRSSPTLHHQATADYGAFYRSALRHLAYAPPASLPADDAAALAVDACLAALLAEDVWSFGDLVSHPLLDALAGGPHAWLGVLVGALADGDLARYEGLAAAHAGEMGAQPALAAAAGGRLREKAAVLCLVAYLAALPPGARRAVPLASIGAVAGGLDGDGAEFLVAKAVAKGLVRGRVDGVAGTVDVAWVAPRTLTLPQVGALAARLEEWVGRVDATGRLLAVEGGALVGAG